MYHEFKRVLKALKEFEPEVAKTTCLAPVGAGAPPISNESIADKRTQVVRHTRLDHGRAIVPVLLRKHLLSSPQGYRSPGKEFLQHSVG